MSRVTATEPQNHQTDLMTFSLQQLTILKQQMDQELAIFQDSLQTLKIAVHKFQESEVSLSKITPETEGKEMLVPLTASMYVPGLLCNTAKVLVDIGTGYFVEKSIEEAKTYFDSRVSFVSEQMQKIQQMAVNKSKVRDAAVEVMQIKLRELGLKELPKK